MNEGSDDFPLDEIVEVALQDNVALLLAAATELDAAWTFDEARGKVDGIGGAEYERLSPAPKLRSLAEGLEAVRLWNERGRVVEYGSA